MSRGNGVSQGTNVSKAQPMQGDGKEEEGSGWQTHLECVEKPLPLSLVPQAGFL